jgi:outer membrane protein TolC
MQHSFSSASFRAGLALAALLAPAAVRGQELPPAKPLDVDRAVSLTFELSPDVLRATEQVALAGGRYREAAGTFDTQLRVKGVGGVVEAELDPETLGREQGRRAALFFLTNGFQRLREQFADNLAEGIVDVPICPPGFADVRIDNQFQQDAGDLGLSEPICLPLGLTSDDARGLLNQVNGSLLVPNNFIDPDFITERLRQFFGLVPDDRIEELRQLGFEQMERLRRLAGSLETGTALSLQRLGLVPITDFTRQLTLDLDLSKPLRTGTLLALQASFSGVEGNYRGKPLDPAFGGKGQDVLFKAGFFVQATQPLFRGRGAVTAAAAERAARIRVDSAQARREHAYASRTLATLRAFIDLVAAQQTLALLEQSLATQRVQLEGVEALVRAKERARSEVVRSQARVSDLERGVSQAKVTVLAARFELARVIGLPAGSVTDAPSAAGVFPEALVELPDVQALDLQARAARLDLRAQQRDVEASIITFDAARAELRPKFDFFVRAGLVGDYRSPFFRVLRDEFNNDPAEPPESPVNYYSPVGFKRALTNKFLPDIRFQLTVEVPFGNNRAKGRLQQSQEALRQTEIRTIDLGRTIHQQIVQADTSLRTAREEVERRRMSVTQHEANWNATQELRRAGDLSLVDVLLTEQDLTNARLELVRAQQALANALAQLRFEAGVLVRFEEGRPAGANLAGIIETR